MRSQADHLPFLRPFDPRHLLGQLGYRPRNLWSLGRPRRRSGWPGRLGRLGGLKRRGWLGLRTRRLLRAGRLYMRRPHMGHKADAGLLGQRRRLRRRPGLRSRLWRSGLGGRLRRRRCWPRSFGRRRMGGLWRRSGRLGLRGRLRPHHLPGRLDHGLRGRRRGGRPLTDDFPHDLPNGGAGRLAGGCGWPGRRLWMRRWALHGRAGRRTALGLRRAARRTCGVLDERAVVPPYLLCPKRHVAI